MLNLARGPLIVTLRAYMHFCHTNLLRISVTNRTIESRKSAMCYMTIDVIVLLKLPSHGTHFMSVRSARFRRFSMDVIGDVHDCYISSVNTAFRNVTVLCGSLQRTHGTDAMSLSWKIELTGMQHVAVRLSSVLFQLYSM